MVDFIVVSDTSVYNGSVTAREVDAPMVDIFVETHWSVTSSRSDIALSDLKQFNRQKYYTVMIFRQDSIIFLNTNTHN